MAQDMNEADPAMGADHDRRYNAGQLLFILKIRDILH
jgi:hypothetical protein